MIVIKNDCKQRYQSFEAKLDINIMTPMGDASLQMIGYGANEEEARKELKVVWERVQVEYEGKNKRETINS